MHRQFPLIDCMERMKCTTIIIDGMNGICVNLTMGVNEKMMKNGYMQQCGQPNAKPIMTGAWFRVVYGPPMKMIIVGVANGIEQTG